MDERQRKLINTKPTISKKAVIEYIEGLKSRIKQLEKSIDTYEKILSEM